jgi:hypothetical protein
VKEKMSCVVPPTPTRSNRLPGGFKKPESELLFVSFESAAALGTTLRALCDRDEPVVIVFDDARLEFATLSASNAMMVRVQVPRASCLAFRGVRVRREFVAAAASLQQWAKLAAACPATSFTLMFEQSERRDEVLHMMLYPRDGIVRDAVVVRSAISPLCDDDDPNVQLLAGHTDGYQYEVVLGAQLLARTLLALIDGTEASVVTLLLGSEAFEVSAVARDGRSHACTSFGVGARCRIASLVDRPLAFTLFRNHRMPAAQVREAALLIGAHSDADADVALRLAVHTATTPPSALPLFIEHRLRSATPQSAYAVRMWIAPCTN